MPEMPATEKIEPAPKAPEVKPVPKPEPKPTRGQLLAEYAALVGDLARLQAHPEASRRLWELHGLISAAK